MTIMALIWETRTTHTSAPQTYFSTDILATSGFNKIVVRVEANFSIDSTDQPLTSLFRLVDTTNQ